MKKKSYKRVKGGVFSNSKFSVRERQRLAKVWPDMSVKRLTVGLKTGFLDPLKCRDTLYNLERQESDKEAKKSEPGFFKGIFNRFTVWPNI